MGILSLNVYILLSKPIKGWMVSHSKGIEKEEKYESFSLTYAAEKWAKPMAETRVYTHKNISFFPLNSLDVGGSILACVQVRRSWTSWCCVHLVRRCILGCGCSRYSSTRWDSNNALRKLSNKPRCVLIFTFYTDFLVISGLVVLFYFILLCIPCLRIYFISFVYYLFDYFMQFV